MINPNAEGLYYSTADFENMKKGTVVILHYNLYNKGTFVWIHSHIQLGANDWRVVGQFAYPNDVLSPEGAYLYANQVDQVCRGSGAEPVCREMPADHEGYYGENDEEVD